MNLVAFCILPDKCQATIREVFKMAIIGSLIRNEREKNERTQDRLLDIPYTDVSNIENGFKKIDKMPELARILTVDLQQVKDFYGAEIVLEQKKKHECSDSVFSVAEEQNRYVRSKNVKQANIKF